MTRSLVLAGGGMRVAWQTGVVRALQEAGLAFAHLDGTSGGIMTAAMMLSGLSPAEMAARWSDIDVKDFSSPLPFKDYLRGPWSLPGVGDADGVIKKVFPHLGIDIDAVRSATTAGTFNVVDFATKTCVALPNTEIDAELLAAGMSLPLVMPPLRRGDRVWIDAVWVKDANVTEALRRGADEVWLIWCIGNSPYWGDGPLEQYVHMIEMSANGALFAELDAARDAGREFALHVVKPRHPLPLDTEFYTGRINADSLVAMGYRDAWDYLDSAAPEGVAKDPSCTAMTEPTEGVRFRERLRGDVAGEPLTLDVTIELPLPEHGPGGPARLAGHVDYGPWGDRVLLAGGRVDVKGNDVVYRARVRVDGGWLELEAAREIEDDKGFDAWTDASRVEFSVGPALTGQLRLRPVEAARLLASVEPVGAHGLLDRAGAIARLGKAGLRTAFQTYA